MGTRITLDAHTLIWYIHKPSRDSLLSEKALSVIREAVIDGIVYVPTIALMEIMRLIEKKKYPISFKDFMFAIQHHKAFEIVSLTSAIVELSEELNHWDIHDRAIIATAIFTDTDLVSNDLTIKKLYKRVIW